MADIQVGWGSQWEALANAINDYYGGGVGSAQYQSVVQMLNSGNYTMEEMESILGSIPEFNRTYNANGQLVRVSYNASTAGNTAVGNIANEINSNVATATNTEFQTVQTITKNQQTGKVTVSDTVTKYSGGVAGTAKAVAASTVTALCAASAGIAVGKTIDSVLYNIYPEFWDEHGMSSLNPATWSSITAGENNFQSSLFNWVFKIDGTTGNPEPYIDQTTFAYMIAYMISQGVFDDDTHYSESDEFDIPILADNRYSYRDAPNETYLLYSDTYGNIQNIPISGNMPKFEHVTAFYGQTDILPQIPNIRTVLSSKTQPQGITPNSFTHNDLTVYYETTRSEGGATASQYLFSVNSVTLMSAYSDYAGQLAWIIEYGTHTGGGVEGITSQDGVTQFDASGITDPSDIDAVLAALMSQFPELWDNRIEVSPDGDNVVTYIPVGFPTGGTGIQPTTEGATATDLTPDISGDGDNATDELIKTLIDAIQSPWSQNGMESDTTTPTEPIDPNSNNGGSGNTPPFVIPIGSASALYSVYNPSQSQLNSLGAWLWSSNFVDQLLKLFNDPMQAIIGLHKVFASPSVSGTGTIKVGYLDSGVGSNLVGSQYTEVDCGTVKINEHFKNALDYLKTDIYLYLPFVGIVPLNVEDVTRASINVKYKVDVLTGACLASVNVTRDANAGGQLYVYAGNCAVQYPLSSGSYMGIVAGALGIAGSVASSVLSGGALLPMALGAGASALGSMKTKVEHSGSLSGNSGAMGIKKPYLIIRRPQTKIADNYTLLAGGSNNIYGVLGGFTGETRVKYVHLENVPATDRELTQIEELLKSGVLI